MMTFVLIAIILLLFYSVFTYISIHTEWNNIRKGKGSAYVSASTVSIIVPFRNEKSNLSALSTAINNQSYPASNYEVIYIDDFSTDMGSEQINLQPNAKILHVSKSSFNKLHGKKNAIQYGISESKYDLVLQVDSDCTVGPEWIELMTKRFHERNLDLACGPVYTQDSNKFWQKFQYLDFIQQSRINKYCLDKKKIPLGSAANMIFKKTAFKELDGYIGNEKYSSGDDVFLIEKFIRAKKRIGFIPDDSAQVITKSLGNFSSLVAQRIRWIGKSKQFKSTKMAWFFFIFSLGLFTPWVLFFAGLFHSDILKVTLWAMGLGVIGKTIILIKHPPSFTQSLILYLGELILYPMIIIKLILPGKIEWKKRELNKMPSPS